MSSSRHVRAARARRPPRPWSPTTEALLEAALREDVGAGDLTAERVVPPELEGRARVLAREAGTLAGTQVAEWVFLRLDPSLRVRLLLSDGSRFAAGGALLEVEGRVAPILTGERLALNFLARLSGVATLTRAFADAVAGTRAAIVDTRKTTPGWRELERAAVRAGGGSNHRFGLHDAVLVKENHVHVAGGVAAAWRAATAPRPGRDPAFVQIEVQDLQELREALDAGARRVLLDNFTLPELAEAVRLARGRAPDAALEASGGVALASVAAVAGTGVDRISVGALTHSARAVDLTLLLEDPPGGPEADRSRVAAGGEPEAARSRSAGGVRP